MIDICCTTCESDKRSIWGPGSSQLELNVLEAGNFINLEQCPECSTMWVHAFYEPHSSFSYFVKWKLLPNDFKKIHDIDSGKTLYNWHVSEAKRLWRTLSDQEQEAVELHRKRAYGHYCPVDMKVDEVNLEEQLK
ncbi:hypothetical protein ACFQHR_00880 [Rufibacter roseus]|uniref:CpXC domain-containing protein n=2 Tax=Rufibacter roseus TaxID=1567108 RepID=A0ABW2DGL2_9BACT